MHGISTDRDFTIRVNGRQLTDGSTVYTVSMRDEHGTYLHFECDSFENAQKLAWEFGKAIDSYSIHCCACF